MRAALFASVVLLGCSKSEPAPPRASASASSAPATAPPVLLGTPSAAELADAASIDGRTPYEQARLYVESGQRWHARLVLEKKALGEGGTAAELELLASICHEQGDDACVEACGARLGKKLVFDAGVVRPPVHAGEHQEPSSNAARARDLLLKNRLAEARALLEDKVVGGSASKEEVRLLRSVCQEQGDRMCVALCNAQLR